MKRFQIVVDGHCIASFDIKSKARKSFKWWVWYFKSKNRDSVVSLVESEFNKVISKN